MASLAVIHTVPVETESWLTRKEVFALTGWTTDQQVSMQVRKGNLRSRENSAVKLANGRFQTEYALSSLPISAQQKHADQLRKKSTQQQLAFVPQEAPRLAAPELVEDHEALERMAVVEKILMFRQVDAAHGHLQLPDGTPVDSVRRMVRYLSIHAVVGGKHPTERTIYRWLDRAEQGGSVALVKHKRKDANTSRFFSDHPDAADLVKSAYFGNGIMPPARSFRACYDVLRKEAHKVGLTREELPDYKTVRLYLKNLPAQLRSYARDGKKAYRETHLPFVRRGYNEAANQIWVSDHMIADVEVLNDCIPDLPIGAPIRMRLTAMLDYRSRYLVGYTWTSQESSVGIVAALGKAIRAHGVPEHFYCDNGKDYVKVAKGATPGYLAQSGPDGWFADELQRLDRSTGVLARLGINVTHCIPHHPQSKHVERFFRTVHERFCSVWQTYTGGTPSRRPDSTAALMMLHRKALRHGELHKSLHPRASVFMALFEVWLDEYHNTPHSGEGMNNRTPAEVFAAERSPVARPTPSESDLSQMLLEFDTRIVDACAVRMFGQRYLPVDPAGWTAMHDLNTERVTVAFDPVDPAYIAVIDDDHRFVCRLQPEQLVAFAPHDPVTQKQIADSMQVRHALQRRSREEVQAISRRRNRLGIKSSLELLAAQVTDPTSDATRVTPRAVKTSQLRKLANQSQAPAYAADIAAQMAAIQEEE